MEVRLIKPEEAVPYLKISAASFIWKFDKEVDKEVEIPVLGAFNNGKLIAGVEIFDFKTNYCGNLLNRSSSRPSMSSLSSMPASRISTLRRAISCTG